MRILFFAQLKDATGCERIEIPISNSFNAEQLWKILIERFPELKKFHNSTRLAKNAEYADKQALFCDADEVALIPPVSGG